MLLHDTEERAGSAYRNICKGDACLRHLLELGLALTKVHGASHASHWTTTSLATARASEQEEKSSKGNDREKKVAQKRNVVSLLLSL